MSLQCSTNVLGGNIPVGRGGALLPDFGRKSTMMLSLTGVLAFAHVNNYSTLDATRDIVVVELDRLYYYWTRCAGGYALVMTSTLDLTTEEDKANG